MYNILGCRCCKASGCRSVRKECGQQNIRCTVRVGYEKLNSGVKTFARLGFAALELASVPALPCSASRDCEWQICLRYSDVQEKNNRQVILTLSFLHVPLALIPYHQLRRAVCIIHPIASTIIRAWFPSSLGRKGLSSGACRVILTDIFS